MTKEELEQTFDEIDKTIKTLRESIPKWHMDIAEKCSYAMVGNAVIRRLFDEPYMEGSAFCESWEKLRKDCAVGDDGDWDWDKLSHAIYGEVMKKLGHRTSLMTILFGLESAIKAVDVMDKIEECWGKDCELTEKYLHLLD